MTCPARFNSVAVGLLAMTWQSLETVDACLARGDSGEEEPCLRLACLRLELLMLAEASERACARGLVTRDQDAQVHHWVETLLTTLDIGTDATTPAQRHLLRKAQDWLFEEVQRLSMQSRNSSAEGLPAPPLRAVG